MSAGSEFHTVGAATRKLRAPKLSLYDGTHNKLDYRCGLKVHFFQKWLRFHYKITIIHITNFIQFLPRDALRKRGLCCHPVSVRLSVTLVYCIQTAEDIVNFLSAR